MKKTMYKLSAFLMALAISGSLLAQVPQKFNYQGIARDAKGNPMGGRTLSLKLSVLPTADASAAEYEEVQTVSTNEFGLYALQIGSGKAKTGEMKNVQWETGNKYIRVAIDPQGGSNFSDAGTTQLLSVPYALYADRAGSAKSGSERTGTVSSNAAHVAGDANYVTKFTALNVIGKSQIFDNGTSVGIGTASPVATASMHIRRSTSGQYLYMENPTPTGFGSFRLYNDVPANFATFTKYGSAAVGGYSGIAALYPYANMLGYGNNGPFLNAGTGNIGFALTKAGTNKLKIHIDAAAERIGFGGNAVPQVPVHFNNTDNTADTVKFTNNTTGHLLTDGTELRFSGNNTRVMNRENGFLILGTNNTDRLAINGSGQVGIGTVSPAAQLDVNGQVRIQGGSPGAGKVLTSDGSGLATWQTPAPGGITGGGTLNYVPRFSPSGTALGNSQLFDNGSRIGLGTLTPNARFEVSTATDTAAYFSSTSGNYLSDGVLRGEYLGSGVYDHVGVYGKALPDSNNAFGIGVAGDGGYMGGQFTGITNDNAIDIYGVYASGAGNADVTGVAAIGIAKDTNLAVGKKTGVLGYASGGLQSHGVSGNAVSDTGTIAYGVRASAEGPGTNYGLYAVATPGAGNYAGYFSGDVQITGNLSKGGGTFKIDHPQDPANKYLIHSFVESPDMKNIYDGTVTTDAQGKAAVQLPAYFEAENKDFRYQLTVIGKDARVYVSRKIQGNQFEVRSSEPHTEISWQVTGIRKDAWAEANRVVPEVEKTGSEKGRYLHPELFGQWPEQGINQPAAPKPVLDMQSHLKTKNK